jgi:hypothetical protein
MTGEDDYESTIEDDYESTKEKKLLCILFAIKIQII